MANPSSAQSKRHAKWCPRKGEWPNMKSGDCSTCGEKVAASKRDLLAELHEEQCAHGATLRRLDEMKRAAKRHEQASAELHDKLEAALAELRDLRRA